MADTPDTPEDERLKFDEFARWRPFSASRLAELAEKFPAPETVELEVARITVDMRIRATALQAASRIQAARNSRGGWSTADSFYETIRLAEQFESYLRGEPRDART